MGIAAYEVSRKGGTLVGYPSAASYIEHGTITGSPAGKFIAPGDLAVGGKGLIYVIENGHHEIDEFSAEGNYIKSYTGAGSPGEFKEEITGIAIDPTTGALLVVEGNAIDEFSPSGEYLTQITGTSSSSPFVALTGSISVNSEGRIYAVDMGAKAVDTFGPSSAAPTLPSVSYAEASNQAPGEATVNAQVDPHSRITECYFEYGTTSSYNTGTAPCNPNPASDPPASEFSEPTEVHAPLSNLSGSTIYHYRLVVRN